MNKSLLSVFVVVTLVGIGLAALPPPPNPTNENPTDFLSKLNLPAALNSALQTIITQMEQAFSNGNVSFSALSAAFTNLKNAFGADLGKMPVNLRNNFTKFVNGLATFAGTNGSQIVSISNLKNISGVNIADMEEKFMGFLIKTYGNGQGGPKSGGAKAGKPSA